MNTLTPSPSVPAKAADQKYCFSCGTVLHLSADRCPTCGAVQPEAVATRAASVASPVTNPPSPVGVPASNPVYCRACGAVLHASAPSCPHCGALQAAGAVSPARAAPPQKWVAVLLAFFLGGIGVHKFYLGRDGQGILYLLFCWTFIPSVIAFVEGFVYLTLSEEQFVRRYG